MKIIDAKKCLSMFQDMYLLNVIDGIGIYSPTYIQYTHYTECNTRGYNSRLSLYSICVIRSGFSVDGTSDRQVFAWRLLVYKSDESI